MTAAALADELAALFARGVEIPLAEPEFDRLALAVFRHQHARNAPYAALCEARGVTPAGVAHWTEVPTVWTDAFKFADFTTVPPEAVRVTYRTSGTTRSEERRGRHLLPDTRLYDASLLPNFRAHVLPDRARMRMLICGPTAESFPDSSLGHMLSRVREAFGAAGSGVFWSREGPEFAGLAAALRAAEGEGEPVCLLGTAFGLVHLLDWLAERDLAFRLPAGSRIMDTGGYKGRSREVPREELRALYGAWLGVPREAVVNEYGMTELGSQFYDPTLRDGAPSDLKSAPPWVRVQVMDPETLAPAPPGAEGLLRFFDLANLHSVAAIQTDDLGIMRAGGFELLGRAAGAEPRGCSLSVEPLLR
jgi:hypothetical protein